MKSKKDTEHDMGLNAIWKADNWYASLPRQEQIYVEHIASKTASQAAVMRMNGDMRRGLDLNPEAFKHVVRPNPNQPEYTNLGNGMFMLGGKKK